MAPKGQWFLHSFVVVFFVFLYTADCRSQHENTAIIKFADDTGVTGLITDDDNSLYRQQISDFVDCCDENYMWEKTKEMIIDF